MSKGIKSLVKDTAIYGVSSIVGKFLNYLLVPLHTYTLAKQSDYGIVTNLYAWSAFLLVILTYGMETGYFRFANKYPEKSDKVYGNTLLSIGATSVFFSLLVIIFHQPIATLLGYQQHSEYIWLLGIVVATDAFASIPFAHLRYSNRPIVFATLKLLYIALNIVFNLFFILLCPWLQTHYPALIDWFYDPNYLVGYIFISNFMATIIQTLFLIPYIFVARFEFDKALLRKILVYSYPLLFLGIAGISNQNLDKVILPLLQLGEDGKAQLGVYGAVGKIAMVIMMFTQAFRYAYEPFVFAQTKDPNSKNSYAMVMKFFIIFSLFIYLIIVFYLDIIKFMIDQSYWEGLPIIPIILFSYIFQGIYFNLSIWYKLSDKNHYGAWFSFIGTLIILIGNLLLIPQYSYWGSVWAAFIGFLAMMLLSYFIGQKYFPIKYDLKSILFYTILMLILYLVGNFVQTPYFILNLAIKTLLLLVYIFFVIKRDFPIQEIPIIKRFIKK